MKRRNKQKVSGEVASTTEMINQTTRRVSSVPNLSLNGSDSIVEQASSEKSELLETVNKFSKESLAMIMSSRYTCVCFPNTGARSCSIVLWKIAGAVLKPNGMTVYS